MKLKRKYLTMVNISLHKSLISSRQKITARLKQANLSSKNDIANFVKKTDFDEKLANIN